MHLLFGCLSSKKLDESLNIELHSFSRKSTEYRGIYHINHVNYVHSVINNYFQVHNEITSEHLNEYLLLIAYKCMYKLRDMQTTLYKLVKCD